MPRVAAFFVAVIAATAMGCSSSSDSFVCCLDIQGNQSFWNCPNQAAFDACCNGDPPGCIASPQDPAAASCTNNASASDCP
jgi:hypothetical protein